MILLIAVGALLLGVLLGAWYAYKVAFYVPRSREEDVYLLPDGQQYAHHRDNLKLCIDRLCAVPYEPVEIRSYDGKVLFGRYYHVRDGAPVQIQFHGYRGSAMRDLCGATPLAIRSGHNVILIDQRGHGGSGGHTITFGVKERRDCQCWCEYAAERFGPEVPLILCGVSMGGATVLMASDMELPPSVKCVIADCPFSSPREIIGQVAADQGLPAKPAVAMCTLGALIYGRFRLGSASAMDSVKRTKLPILILHGEEDRYVPCAMSQRLRELNQQLVQLETFPKAAHGMSYMEDPQRYELAVDQFLQKNLAG